MINNKPRKYRRGNSILRYYIDKDRDEFMTELIKKQGYKNDY